MALDRATRGMVAAFALGAAAYGVVIYTDAPTSKGEGNVVLGPAERIPSPVKGASGIACHPSRPPRLFLVGDRGDVAELNDAGSLLWSHSLGGDLEDVALHTPTGRLLIVDETAAELILYDPERRREETRWSLDTRGLLARRPAYGKDGFEGLAFRAAAKEPGGGVTYLVHQRAPAMVVVLEFDPAQKGRTVGEEAVRARWPLEGYREGNAVTYVPSLDRFLVVAGGRLVVLTAGGKVERDVPLEGVQPEGVCIDGEGTLWVADDRGGHLLRFRNALRILQSGRAREERPHEPNG